MENHTRTPGQRTDSQSHEDSASLKTQNLRSWLYALGVFVLALLPRIWDLSAIITPDERRWVERSVAFFSALLQQDWVSTFQEGHPGVTTMWTGTLGLWGKYLQSYSDMPLPQYLAQVTTRPSVSLEYLAPTRLPTAILTALGIVLVYLLLLRLFNTLPALLAAVLLALDPFYLAHSRVIHHDALATTFSLIALVAFLGYVWRRQSVLWLILSGVSAGLAFLSKGSSLFLIPFMGLILLWAIWVDIRRQPNAWRHALAGRVGVGLVWFAVAAAVFIIVWPAMWVEPVATVSGMLEKAVGFAQEAHTKGNYFLGQPVADPGLLFYPLVLLFRTTPISLLGLLLFIVQLVLYARRHGVTALLDSAGVQVQVSLFLYLVIFTLCMGAGSKKFDRYLLPVFPVVDILAGIAIAQAVRRITVGPEAERDGNKIPPAGKTPAPRHTTQTPPAATWIVVAAVLIMQGLASLPQHPYYLSAYNALAGGPWLATKAILVGWGEGLEQAAAYLNGRSDVEDTKVSLFYYRDFATFFQGQGQKLRDDNPDNPVPWQGSDYVVFYINQVQRQIPDAATVDYFQAQTPEYSFSRNGIPYIQVYRTPPVVPDELLPGEHVQRVDLDGKLELLGYTVDTDRREEGKIGVSLYWRALTDLDEDYQVQIELADESGTVWGDTGGLLYAEDIPTSDWPANHVMHTPFEMTVDDGFDLDAEGYSIQLSVSPGDQVVVLGE